MKIIERQGREMSRKRKRISQGKIKLTEVETD